MPQLSGHPIAGAAAPPALNRSNIAFQPGLYDNDFVGDCAEAGYANCMRAASALCGFDIPMPENAPITFYEKFGYNPNAPLVNGENPTDQGTLLTDLLAYQLQHGFDNGGQVPMVGSFATFDPANLTLHQNAITRCGTVYPGFALSISDQNSAPPWDINPPSSAGDPTAGSWGLHCAPEFDFTGTEDTDLVILLTWGTLIPVTWRWVRQRCQEAHIIYWPQLQSPAGLNFDGVNRDQLRAESFAFIS